MGQPPHVLSIVPCPCGSHETYWHRPSIGVSVYACDTCWSMDAANPDRRAPTLREKVREKGKGEP